MRRSRDYYMRRLDRLVSDIIENKRVDLTQLSNETELGLESVLDDYILEKFLTIGDKSFNRDGYRNATDKIIEHLNLHV